MPGNFERVGSFEKSTYSKTVLVTVDRVFARVCETGAVMQGKWLRGVAAFAKENNLVVSHDFAYSDISFSGKSPSFSAGSRS